jgi:hypothetical protein
MNYGKFSGDPEVRWKVSAREPDRDMNLLSDFHFVDPASRMWHAPKESTVDGASIPRALWTVVGAPFCGDYRRASVVHDVACVDAGNDKKKRKAADQMFFYACRAGGCSWSQSVVLYIGVRIGAAAAFVPAWNTAVLAENDGPRAHRTEAEIQLETDFGDISDRVIAGGETDDIEIIEQRFQGAVLAVKGWSVPI